MGTVCPRWWFDNWVLWCHGHGRHYSLCSATDLNTRERRQIKLPTTVHSCRLGDRMHYVAIACQTLTNMPSSLPACIMIRDDMELNGMANKQGNNWISECCVIAVSQSVSEWATSILHPFNTSCCPTNCISIVLPMLGSAKKVVRRTSCRACSRGVYTLGEHDCIGVDHLNAIGRCRAVSGWPGHHYVALAMGNVLGHALSYCWHIVNFNYNVMLIWRVLYQLYQLVLHGPSSECI